MKYLEYSYCVDTPITSAFSKVIDLEALHENVQIFDHGTLVSDDSRPEAIGKKYTLSIQASHVTIETTLIVEKVEVPNRIHLSYRYRILDAAGLETDFSVFPWESMDCFIHFSDRRGKTMVRTIMIANGVKSMGQKVRARFFSIINWFQQRKINSRVKSYVENFA